MIKYNHKNLKIGIVGKREIVSNQILHENLKNTISGILKKEKTKHFVGYSALANGSDTIFAEIVTTEYNQPLEIILPFETTEYEKDFIDEGERKIFEKWKSSIGISQIVTKNVPQNIEQRNEAYLALGKYIVDFCDYVIFVWDGLKPNGKGGSAEILGYAHHFKKNKYVVIQVDSHKIDYVHSQIETQLIDSDKKALILKKKYEFIWLTSIISGWLTTLCFAIALSFHISIIFEFILTSLELIFIFIVFFLIRFAKIINLHKTLLMERMRTEKLRILKVIQQTDIPIINPEILNSEDQIILNIANKVSKPKLNNYQSLYYKYFVISTFIAHQIKYHNNKLNSVICKKPEKLELIKNIIYILFLFVILFHFSNLILNVFQFNIPFLSKYTYPHGLIKFLSILLPSTYAAFEGLLFFKDWNNLKDQSIKCVQQITELESSLDSCKLTENTLSQILNQVCNLMLLDNKNWKNMLIKKETPHPII